MGVSEGPARLRFDDVVVDRGAMLVTRRGVRIDVEPKAFDVLLHLAERPGQLVTKGELIASVWKGVAVTDHVLTRVVGQLRRALGDAAREAKYIETVPTRGYRFIAPVDVEAVQTSDAAAMPSLRPGVADTVPQSATMIEETPLPTPTPPRRGQPRREPAAPGVRLSWLRVAVVLVVAVGLAGVGGWLMATRAMSPGEWTQPPARPRQLTFAPALDAYPDFSPDGRFLAYASSASGTFQIEVRPLTPDARSQRVTTDDGGNIQPDWSPDGQRLAYHSMVSGGVWVIPALGGVPRRVVAVGASPAWSPDGRVIAFQSGEPASVEIGGTPPPSQLWLVDASGVASPRPLTRARHPVGGHTEPAWSPDGQRVAFITRSVARAEIWSIGAGGGEPRFLSACSGPCSRVVYEPSGRAVIFSVSGQGYFRQPIDAATGSAAGSPELILSQRADFAGYIAISPDGRSAAVTDLVVRSNLYALALDARGQAAGVPKALTNTTGRAMTPAFSPDGHRLAFNARRESMQICLVSAEGGEVTPLPVPAGFTNTYRPAWAPNGEILGLAIGATSAAVVAINPESRETRILARLGGGAVSDNLQFLAPSFSADGRRLVFSREDREGIGVWSMDLASRELHRLTPADEDATFPTPSPDGRSIAYERVAGGSMQVVVIPSGGGPGRQLTSGRGLTWPHSWSATGDRIFVAMRRGSSWSIGALSPTTGELTVLTTVRTPHSFLRYPAVSPSGDRVVYEQTETTGNIWQVPLWTGAGGGTR